MKLVKFADGKFGVMRKRRWRKPEFMSLLSPGRWWTEVSYVNDYCKGTEEKARAALAEASLEFTVTE